MDRTWLAVGSIFMFLAVAAGAFGRHALKTRLSPDLLETFEVAVRYHLIHGLAIIAVSLIAPHSGGAVQAAGVLFTLGILVFSGSLYALALTGVRALGALTPIGGILFLAGWLVLLWVAVVSPSGAATP